MLGGLGLSGQRRTFPIVPDPDMKLYLPGKIDGPFQRTPADFLIGTEGCIAIAHYGRDIDPAGRRRSHVVGRRAPGHARSRRHLDDPDVLSQPPIERTFVARFKFSSATRRRHMRARRRGMRPSDSS